MNKASAILAILIAFVGGFAVGNLTSGDSDTSGEEVAAVELAGDQGAAAGAAANAPAAPADGIERYNVPVTSAQPAKGPADALVTIVIFSDFQCPFCSRVLPTTTRIMSEYAGKVRIVWRNQPLPFHPNAMPAAELAMEAFAQGGSDKFWAMHDKIYANQRAIDRPDLERYATELGLNMTGVRNALDNNTHQAAIDADKALGTRLGANGTPSFFINGRPLVGAQPFPAFKTIIDEEITRAQGLVRGGTPAAQVYASLTRGRPTQKQAPAKQAPAQARRQPDPNAVYKVQLTGNEPSAGPADALVTIVQFSDFQCPFCSRVEPTITQIKERYGNDVRVVWMNNPLPFHPNAKPAAKLALEAFQQGGNAKFWAMHNLMFEHQRELTRENLETYAQQVGLNMAQVRAALDSDEHEDEITRTQGIARTFGASGTPAFFINGRNLRGAQPLAAFTAVIDQELAKARALVAAGTPRNQVYARTIANGATSPQFVGGGNAPAAPARPAAPPADQVYRIPVPANAPSKGNANASVVIQQFSDFQCPFCSRVEPTVEQIMREYGTRVRIVWRNYPLPFHPNATPAANAAMEVFRQGGNDKFWAYHNLIFSNQPDLDRAHLESWAEQLGGINMAQLRAAIDGSTHQASIDADKQAVTAAGARIGTPSFFINGRLVQGAQPFAAFKTAIDRALAEAN
ncbi:MAG: thioredoxin domain-containing protein [Deltaproteobacteria bacterium]|nr:thioredoxin domain-containing protein [Deltaproteobacteria bacterium]